MGSATTHFSLCTIARTDARVASRNVVVVPWLAVVSLAAFLLITFPLRWLINRRRHDEPAGLGLRERRPLAWWLADALFVAGFVIMLGGAALQGAGQIGVAIAGHVAFGVGGILVLLVATALLVWAQETMGRAWRPAIPPADGGDLVTGGPFRAVRNPAYLAMLAAGLGAVLLAQNLLTFAGWISLLTSLMLTARAEEPLLHSRHGDAYRDYAARVGRFVPGVGRLRGGSLGS